MKGRRIPGVCIVIALAGCLGFYFLWPRENRSSAPGAAVSQVESTTGTPRPPEREQPEDSSAVPEIDASRIQRILETPQTYDGEIRERLVALGPAAVPAIGQALSTGYAFPIVLVDALKELGDPRAVAPTLAFLKGRPPYSDADESFVTARIVEALGSMQNPDTCAPLAEIVREGSAHPRVRLAAASAASRLCGTEISGPAADLILEFHRNKPQVMKPNPEYTDVELYSALAEVKNDEATDIVVGVMDRSTEGYMLDPIISAAARRGDAKLTDALKRVVRKSDPEVPLESRFKAARALLALDGRPDSSLREKVGQLAAQAEADGYPPQFVAEARELERKYE
jgi:hypothetical protein